MTLFHNGFAEWSLSFLDLTDPRNPLFQTAVWALEDENMQMEGDVMMIQV